MLNNDLTTLHSRLDDVNARIERLEARIPSDPVGDSFHLGRVGGSGDRRTLARLNRLRATALDRILDTAIELEPLYRERDRLRRQIEDVESGRAERRARARAEREERVRGARVGDVVLDSAFGEVRVVRVNRKTLTIETPSGYREARPYALILDVVARAEESA